ncbi:MAG: response regulator [Lachnospiraceae bacterium]|nr:response regulator [Lachnospiraceae bacterium]
MDSIDEIIMSDSFSTGEFGLKQLLQVWRDYYDEIFEVDLSNGSYRTMMNNGTAYWPQKGFVDIEVMTLAEQRVHPDDKEAFRSFFDLDLVRDNLQKGVYVSKLNFRIKSMNDEYIWVKIKNMIPTKTFGEQAHMFACFRKADKETDETLRYRQELNDALENERSQCAQKTALIDTIASEIRSPLSGIIGMAGLAMDDASKNSEATADKLLKIKDEARRLSRILNGVLRANRNEDDVPEFETEDHPVNNIQYIYGSGTDVPVSQGEYAELVPEDFAFSPDYVDDHEEFEPSQYDFTGRRILICEANSLNREVMAQQLKNAGAEVTDVDSGKAAVIEFVSKPAGHYDLVLMGIDTAEMDGYSAVRCIRICGKDDAREIPVFAATSKYLATDIAKAVDCGFDALFAKPVDFRALFDRINRQFLKISD